LTPRSESELGREGLPARRVRRVVGLRREEVALLAGVSVPYYTRLERGDARGATDAVLDTISRALLLDDAERSHLFGLVRAARPGSRYARSCGTCWRR
jgi:transcriptional regulator with XRE-family HTH domain